MPQPTIAPLNARAMRLIHAALTLGPLLTGIVFTIVRRTSPLPVLPQASAISLALTIAAIVMLAVALTVLRPRIPQQPAEQSADAFWGDAQARMSALTLWAVVEGATLLAGVGYLLTGAPAPTLALVLGIVTLWSLRPKRLELNEGS